jgi:hypothetical protein
MGRKKHMLSVIKARCNRKGIDFTLTEDDFELPEFCPVLGTKLVMGTRAVAADSMTIDRIDATKGYMPGNVQVMSYLANCMKSNATPEQLLSFADWVYKTYGAK